MCHNSFLPFQCNIGIGYFSTMYGLVIDNLVEINMVDASGNAITVNKTHNEDLWWAMRGIGPGYIGLVTSVKLKVFKADDLKLTYLKLRFNNTCFKSVMGNYPKWLDWVEKNDPYINSVITIRSGEKSTRDILICFYFFSSLFLNCRSLSRRKLGQT